MILPAGVNKATGLAHALEKMALSPHNAVAIGDAENDHALLSLCECSAAVSNALPTLKSTADIVTKGDHGAGVVELVDELLRDDLSSRDPQLTRHHVSLGTDDHGSEVLISPHGETVLLIGSGERSEVAAVLMERLAAKSYTLCVIDVDGRYGDLALAKAVSLGGPTGPPTTDEIVKLFRGADKSGVINLAGLSPEDRLPFLKELTPKLVELRAHLGRPHWTTLDATQDVLPADGTASEVLPLGAGDSVLHITPRPALVAREVLRATTLVIALGASGQALLDEFCQVSGVTPPATKLPPVSEGAALAWRPTSPNAQPFRLNIAVPQTARSA
jgi:hypothetical protein